MNVMILFPVYLLLLAEYTVGNPYLNVTIVETRPWPKQMIGGNFTVIAKIENGNGFSDVITWSKGGVNVSRLEISSIGAVHYARGDSPTGSSVQVSWNITSNASTASSVTYFSMKLVGIRQTENGTLVEIFGSTKQYFQFRLNLEKFFGDPYLNLTVVETSPWPKQVIGGNFTFTTRIENGNGFNDIIRWSKGGIFSVQLQITSNGDVQFSRGFAPSGSSVQFSWNIATSRSFGSSVTNFTMRAIKIPESENGTLVRIYGTTKEYFQLRLNVQNCPSTINTDLSVVAASNIYGSLGQYQCREGGVLHRSDVLQLVTSNRTTCMNSAEWEGQDYMTCWKAPSVSLIGSKYHMSNKSASFFCKYANDVFPPVTSVRFMVNNNALESKETNISIRMARELNGKTVTCQAISNYTLLHPNAGRSHSILLNVSYAPYTNGSAYSCDFASSRVKNCSIEFYANPAPIKVVLFQPGKSSSKDVTTSVLPRGEIHTLVLTKTNFVDNGIYIINVSSAIYETSFQLHVTIAMTTTVVTNPITTVATNQTTVTMYPVTTVATNPTTVVPHPSTVDAKPATVAANESFAIPVAVAVSVAANLVLIGAALFYYRFKKKRSREKAGRPFPFQISSPAIRRTRNQDQAIDLPQRVEKPTEVVDIKTDANGYLIFAPVQEKNKEHVYESIQIKDTNVENEYLGD